MTESRHGELIERLEKATERSWPIDHDIAVVVGASGWPPYTSSVDAALSLVRQLLPAQDYDLTLTITHTAFSATAHLEHWDGEEWIAQKPTAPLAILIVLFRALDAQ